jgi:Family of unknown function (DUF6115)
MPFIDLKFLTFTQISIDLIIVMVFIFLIKRFRHFNKGPSFDKPTKVFESFLIDAEKMAGQFKAQLEEKHRLIQNLNEQLDKRIISLNVLLNRADVLLSSQSEGGKEPNTNKEATEGQQTEILKLAREGRSAEKIAQILSIPQGEVRLVLDLKKKFLRMAKTEPLS